MFSYTHQTFHFFGGGSEARPLTNGVPSLWSP